MAKNYTEEQVLEAVKKSNGVVEYVAINLGCAWLTARTYIDKFESCKDAMAVLDCKLNALAYKSFMKAIDEGQRWAVERILDTSARRNGHGIVEHVLEVEAPRLIMNRAPTPDAKPEE